MLWLFAVLWFGAPFLLGAAYAYVFRRMRLLWVAILTPLMLSAAAMILAPSITVLTGMSEMRGAALALLLITGLAGGGAYAPDAWRWLVPRDDRAPDRRPASPRHQSAAGDPSLPAAEPAAPPVMATTAGLWPSPGQEPAAKGGVTVHAEYTDDREPITAQIPAAGPAEQADLRAAPEHRRSAPPLRGAVQELNAVLDQVLPALDGGGAAPGRRLVEEAACRAVAQLTGSLREVLAALAAVEAAEASLRAALQRLAPGDAVATSGPAEPAVPAATRGADTEEAAPRPAAVTPRVDPAGPMPHETHALSPSMAALDTGAGPVARRAGSAGAAPARRDAVMTQPPEIADQDARSAPRPAANGAATADGERFDIPVSRRPPEHAYRPNVRLVGAEPAELSAGQAHAVFHDDRRATAEEGEGTGQSGRQTAGGQPIAVFITGPGTPLDLRRIFDAMNQIEGIRNPRLERYDRSGAVVLVETTLQPDTLALQETLTTIFERSVTGRWVNPHEYVATLGSA